MPRGVANHFNRGEIDQRALARDDLKRINNSASLMRNFIPSRLGSMIYRPGLEYIATLDPSFIHKKVRFVAAIDNTASLDFYKDQVEFIVNDEQILTTAVTSAFTNEDFKTDIAGWTDASNGAGATAWYDYGTGDGALALTGDGVSNAISYYTIGTTELGVEHFMRLLVDYAPVTVKIGTSGQGSHDIFKGELKPGEHVLTFTPQANVTITFENTKKYRALINNVSFDGAGPLSIQTPLTAATLTSLRTVQSADIIFCTHAGKTFHVEHRGDKSWSIVDFRYEDGPFKVINTSNISMTPGAINGDTTLTASEDYFETGHVGALFKVGSVGQDVQSIVSIDGGAGTNSVEVTGVGTTSRAMSAVVSGIVGAVTVHLQRSVDEDNWEDVKTYAVDGTDAYNDGLDNTIYFYRLFIKSGNNAPLDNVDLSITRGSGSIEGIGRVTKYVSPTVVNVQVLREFGKAEASLDWYEGAWSDEEQYPATIDIEEGRLWLAGKEEVWGSVSDSYYSFDRDILGDSASILKTIGFGPSDPIKWMKGAGQLIMGTTGDEIALKASSFGEILTNATAHPVRGSDQGSADIEPEKIGDIIYFVQRSGNKIYALLNEVGRDSFDTSDAALLNQDILSPGITRIASTRQPETRMLVVLNDGSVAIYTVDAAEEVSGWSRFSTSGLVKDILVLPGADEDRVYFVVLRGTDVFLEKMAKFQDSIGGFISETYDSFIRLTSPGPTLTVGHLSAGTSVGVWADGRDRGTYTVSAGQITVTESWTNVIVGIRYEADYISNKLSGYVQESVLTEKKRVVDTGLVMQNYVPGSLKIGPDADSLRAMPEIEEGKEVDPDVTISDYSEVPFEFDGEEEVDPRIHMRATGPCEILALTYNVEYENPSSDKG